MDPAIAFGGQALGAMLELVRSHTGIDMTERKRALLEGRLQPRLRALGLASYEQYAALVRQGGPEVQAFINIVTTSDTRFFRTPAVWDYLAADFLPAWQARCPGRLLRIWSAAAASGEEAYSAAMLCEEFARAHPSFRYQIHGTDIATNVLDAAIAGRYSGRSADLLRASHPALAARYFDDAGGALVALAPLRAGIRFSVHNLLAPPGGAHVYDLVFLRNVLIYFDEDHQRRVLQQVGRAMGPHARLILGEQESITRLATSFAYLQDHVYGKAAADG